MSQSEHPIVHIDEFFLLICYSARFLQYQGHITGIGNMENTFGIVCSNTDKTSSGDTHFTDTVPPEICDKVPACALMVGYKNTPLPCLYSFQCFFIIRIHSPGSESSSWSAHSTGSIDRTAYIILRHFQGESTLACGFDRDCRTTANHSSLIKGCSRTPIISPVVSISNRISNL